MDFNSLIHVAQKNDNKQKTEFKYYSTKFEPPKKEEKKTKQLSENIKKFLAKKEAEEKKKAVAAKLKKEELLALRSKDKKATRRVSVMLKRTKSANKSVIDDAVDKDNTAVTLAGPSQPDEDDYGYVSQEASAFYNKMMAKYSTLPEEPKLFSSAKKNTNINLSGTKDRVRAALLKEQEEALLPHRRKRKSKHDAEESETTKSTEDINSNSNDKIEPPAEKPKPKPKPMAPPAMNFQDLLKLAEKKQFEPIKIEPKKVSEEDEHPMTKKQRREYEKEKARREHREERRKAMENGQNIKPEPTKNNMPPPNKISKLNTDTNKSSSPESRNKESYPSSSSKSIPKLENRKTELYDKSASLSKTSKLREELEKSKDINKSKSSSCSEPARSSSSNKERLLKKSYDENKNIPKRDTDNFKIPDSNEKLMKTVPKSKESEYSTFKTKPGSSEFRRSSGSDDRSNYQSSRPKPTPQSDVRSKLPDGRPKQLSTNIKMKQGPPGSDRTKQYPYDGRPKQFPPPDVRSKQFPPSDVRSKFPPSDVRSKQFPPDIQKRKKGLVANKGRIIEDDDSEYDSEMDDFIDDGPGEGEDYSKYISEIFGYDKSRYRDAPEDDDGMESSFSQMMREEYISSKIGIMEDLEDMKQEAIDKKVKAAKKKVMTKR